MEFFVYVVFCSIVLSMHLSRKNSVNDGANLGTLINKGNNKITELRTILQRESQNL
jgi:hypothetical protein